MIQLFSSASKGNQKQKVLNVNSKEEEADIRILSHFQSNVQQCVVGFFSFFKLSFVSFTVFFLSFFSFLFFF